MSPRFPIGVATMYRPGFIIFVIILFIFLNSCSPANNSSLKDLKTTPTDLKISKKIDDDAKIYQEDKKNKEKETKKPHSPYKNISLNTDISIILPANKKYEVTQQFINVIELATYQKKLENIKFTIDLYKDVNDLKKIIDKNLVSGKIFIGPLETSETEFLNNYCEEGVVFFSFSSKKDLAKKCIFLVNFFPKNELKTIFNFFPPNSKIALLFPENSYGYKVNLLVDEIANQSNSIIINRASYKEDLTNVREAIKELGKYELRKYELFRQKQILKNKKDQQSKNRLKQLEKFQTTKDLDFTHILIPDYGLRLLQVAPLLPYYDVDPNIVQFVGTGVWDDPVFFFEPALQSAIFPGVQAIKRKKLINEYNKIFDSKFMRISTLPYDLIGLLYYIYEQKLTLEELYGLLNNSNIKFDGVDGQFYFNNNIIERDLEVLQISKGQALKLTN